MIWPARIASLLGLASVQAAACPFCYTAAAAAKAGAIRALQSGILVLILPPILIFAAIAAFRRRHRYDEVRHPAPTAAARD
jgi:hypothetical protein